MDMRNGCSAAGFLIQTVVEETEEGLDEEEGDDDGAEDSVG
jgi:hypothetical protein